MNQRALEAARRRQVLMLQCAAQREQLLQAASIIHSRLQSVDRGVELVRGLRLSPVMLAGAAALALGLGSTRLVRLLGRGYLVFNTVQRLWRSLQRAEPGGGA